MERRRGKGGGCRLRSGVPDNAVSRKVCHLCASSSSLSPTQALICVETKMDTVVSLSTYCAETLEKGCSRKSGKLVK